MQPFRLILTISMLALTTASPVIVSAQPKSVTPVRLVDRVIAIVNQDIITESELNRRERQFRENMRREGVTPPEPKVMREQVLDRMINDRVLLQRAQEVGVRVDDLTVDRSLARIADQNGLSLSGLRNQLEAEGTSFDSFRQDIRDEIILTRLRERDVDSRLQITESEVDTFLAAQGDSVRRTEEYKVSQILIRVAESASKQELDAARAKIGQAQAALRGGRAFAEIAKEFSEAPEREQGGSLGWRPTELVPTLFLDALRQLKPGQVSPVVRSPNGLHILLFEEQRVTVKTPEVPVHRARHILVRIDNNVTEEIARRRILEIRRRLESGADFAQLARELSDDRGSATRGGELDWTYPGDLVPEFERAMVALQPGQVSGPVRSVFGIHLIQLMERKREPMGEQRLRMLARNLVRDQKLAEAVADWTREIRANAYVEIKRDDL
jgi:peptidyl-prolyl cis-trans isomerase SurA